VDAVDSLSTTCLLTMFAQAISLAPATMQLMPVKLNSDVQPRIAPIRSARMTPLTCKVVAPSRSSNSRVWFDQWFQAKLPSPETSLAISAGDHVQQQPLWLHLAGTMLSLGATGALALILVRNPAA